MVKNHDWSIKLDGEEFIKGLEKASKELVLLETERMKATVEFVKAEAVKEAPSDTGNLRAAMISDVEVRKSEIVGRVGNIAEYSAYVHQGTGIYAKDGNGRKSPWRVVTLYKGKKVSFITLGQKPNPFLTRAKDKNMDKIKKLLGVK